jgi:hypothetical protein
MTVIALLVLALAIACVCEWRLVVLYGRWLARPENWESWP